MIDNLPSGNRQTVLDKLHGLLPIMAIGIILSAAAAWWQQQYEHGAAVQRFTAAAEVRFFAIGASFKAATENLYGVDTLFYESGDITQNSFCLFASDVVERHPEVRSLVWVPRIPQDQRESYEESRIRLFDRATDGALVTAPNRPEHYPAQYVAPFERGFVVEGFDFASEPEAKKALERARDSGRLSAISRPSRVSTAAADSLDSDYLVVRPVYRANASTYTESERRKNLKGFLIGAFRLDQMVEHGLARVPTEGLDLWLYGNLEGDGKRLLFHYPSRTRSADTTMSTAVPSLPNKDVITHASRWDLVDRGWELVAAEAPGFSGAQEWESWAIFVTGVVLTTMLVAYLVRTHEANAKVVEASIMLRTIIDHIPVRVFWKDKDLRYLGCNKLFAKDAGIADPKELIGLNDFDAAWPENAEAYRADDRKVLDTLEPYIAFEEEQTRPSGETAYLLTSKTPLHDAAGEVIGVLGTYEDITERKDIEARLNQAQKMEAVGQLTGGIAHDFNNILAVIIGNLDLLQRSVTDPKSKQRLENATQATLRGASLTQRLLAFSRRQKLEPKLTEVNELVEGMFDLLNRTLGETVELQISLGKDVASTMIDPMQLENALLNLAINARDAMPDGGQLTIETERQVFDEDYVATYPYAKPGSYIMVAVSDTGAGMPQEVIDKAFEPFFTTKDVGKGTGLGLSMVYGFVKQSKGHIHLYSEPSHGTSVKIYLPEWQDEANSIQQGRIESEDKVADRRNQYITILVVEDDPEVREVVVGNLEELGYRLLVAGNGPEAMAVIEALPKDDKVDLLFTDVVMPGGMTGPELAIKVKERLPATKILFASGNPRNAFERCHGSHFDAPLLVKPYRSEALANTINDLISDAGAESASRDVRTNKA